MTTFHKDYDDKSKITKCEAKEILNEKTKSQLKK
jgi:hypothetical protein